MIVSTESASHYRWGEICEGWHLAQSKGLSVIQERVPPGGHEMTHYHNHAEQFFFVLSGTATLKVNNESFELRPQQGLYLHPGIPHQLCNLHGDDLSFLVISSPPSHGDRVDI
ncbi:MAG: cupin domain-containing protein [Pseudomonadota bacterium]